MSKDTLNWQNDEDCVAVAQFILEWIKAEDGDSVSSDSLSYSLQRTTVWALLDDLLTPIEDDRLTDTANALLEQIRR